MKNFRKILIVCFLILVVFAASCAQLIQKKGKETPSAVWRLGSQGLVLNFATNLPPTKLYDNEEFNALIEIKNVGAFRVGGPGDRLYLSGFAPAILPGISTIGEKIPDIEGKSEFNPQGAFDSVAFKSPISRLTVDRYSFNLLATACYQYETKAEAGVCIDPQPFAPAVRPKICIPTSVALSGGQAAPIAVTSVALEPRPGLTIFRITVQNVGGGQAFRAGLEYLTKCSPYDLRGLAFEDVDYVQLFEVSLAGTSILSTCKPLDRGHIRLSGGIGTVVCEARTYGASAYVAPLTIGLRYGYQNWISLPIEIFRTP